MASQIHFVDIKGKPLLSRDYKGDISSSAIERFPLLLLENEDSEDYKPLFYDNGINYIYIAHNNLYLCALTRNNDNVMLIVVFLLQIIEVLTEYFKLLEEESIRDNFVIIYELLDEMMDYGTPQTTDTKILKQYITQDYYKLIRHSTNRQVQPPNAVTNAVSWRPDGITYKKNEAFLDVIELINMLILASGLVLNSEILGEIKIKLHLLGMPDLRLGLNDKNIFNISSGGGENDENGGAQPSNPKGIEMEDIKFHQCVRLLKFENDRIITFIPPDGEFTLMLYRLLLTQFLVKPLILVNCKTKIHKHLRIEIICTVRAQIKKKLTANNVEIIIPIPEDADTPKFTPEVGKVKWYPERSEVVWKIKTFGGGKQFSMKAELGLPAVVDSEELLSKKPIKVKFSIPYFTTSGIQVRYLRINEPKLQYQSYPWVRYITQNGEDYTVRMK